MVPAEGAVELVLDALLETPGPPVPAPGHDYRLSVSRYRVLRVLKGRYELPFVLVAHERPDLSLPAFQPNTRKELELTSRFPAHASLANPFSAGSPGAPVFYCIRERVIEAATPNTSG